jgi:hypothetical protein
MASNSFPSIGNVQNPFTIQAAGYTGIFQIAYSGASSFTISEQASSYNQIAFATSANSLYFSSTFAITTTDTNGNGFFADMKNGVKMFDNNHIWYDNSGNQVIGSQGSGIAAPSGGAIIDVQARAAIAAIISALQASTGHGLISG